MREPTVRDALLALAPYLIATLLGALLVVSFVWPLAAP